MPPATKHTRRWFSFSLRTMLIAAVMLLQRHVLCEPGGSRASAAENPQQRAAKRDDDAPAPGIEVADEGSELLREIRRASRPILAAMASEHGYRLTEDEDLRRVPPPHSAIRDEYYRIGHPGQAQTHRKPPSSMVFRWSARDGRLEPLGISFGSHSVGSLLDAVAGIKDQMIDGPKEAINQAIPGDWVVRKDTKDFQIVRQLDSILRDELSMPVHLELREVTRQVYVVSGKYKFTPLAGKPEKGKLFLADKTIETDPIEIVARQNVPNDIVGGGSGRFNDLLDWLGRWIETPVVAEVETPIINELSWYLNERSPATAETRRADHDPKLVLANVATQTGLTFTKAKRPVRVLFVTRLE